MNKAVILQVGVKLRYLAHINVQKLFCELNKYDFLRKNICDWGSVTISFSRQDEILHFKTEFTSDMH